MPAPLFLIGFMAAGKTSVGRALAAQTHRRFVDVDDVIAGMGEPVAALVARDEAEFRRREAKALDEVSAATDGPVIATGGGAAAFGNNVERMRRTGLVVALDVDLEAVTDRSKNGPERPLLAKAKELMAARAASYRRAHAVVDTSGRTIDEVVRAVRHVEAAWHRLPERYRDATIVELEERSYPVIVHDGAIDGDLVPQATRVAVITDDHVARHWQLPVASDIVSIKPGEASKSFATYQALCEDLVARGLDRQSEIVALGGGVVGDLAGFVAATLFRGIPIIQLPTTLVAMTDAAIGGKTAIDLPAGKNLVGAFHQPKLVVCGLATLGTLPQRERRAGFGELWKYALLDGQALWELVDACAAWGNAGGEPPPELREVITRCIAYKAAVVGKDEREVAGHRALLNLGHTVGHAIETESGVLHGEAVGLGLVAACRVSAALGYPDRESEITAALQRTGLPSQLDSYLSEHTLDRVGVDKKRIGDKVRFIVVREVGACEPTVIPITDLRRILRAKPTP